MTIERELALDPITGDLRVEGGRLVVISGAEALAQRIAVRLRTFLGEWVFDTTLGTPWLQNIHGTRRREDLVQNILRRRVLDTPGVDSVVGFSARIDPQTRVVTVSGEVIGESVGPSPVSVSVGV